jgi:hypothetical protein
MAAQAECHVCDFSLGILGVKAQALRPFEQNLAGSRQADAATYFSNRGAAFCFQPADAARQSRLGAVQAFCGLPDMFELRNGFEVAKITQVHSKSKIDVFEKIIDWTVSFAASILKHITKKPALWPAIRGDKHVAEPPYFGRFLCSRCCSDLVRTNLSQSSHPSGGSLPRWEGRTSLRARSRKR